MVQSTHLKLCRDHNLLCPYELNSSKCVGDLENHLAHTTWMPRSLAQLVISPITYSAEKPLKISMHNENQLYYSSTYRSTKSAYCRPSKDENVPSRPYFYIHPVRFRIYEKMRKWDGKREGVYPARICGILFLAGIIPYL